MEKIYPESEYLALIPRLSRGELDPTERESLLAWSKASPENKKAFEEALLVWETSQKLPAIEVDENQAWQRLQNNLQTANSEQTSSKPNSGFGWWMRIAAALIIGLSAAGYFFLSESADGYQEMIVADQAMTNADREVVLADGTRVWLNKNSKLAYPSEFDGDQRIVRLEGEAFFDVARDPSKPFIIETASSETQVLGTSFNVRAYPQEEAVEVVVATGKVALREAGNSDNEVRLTPSEKGVFNTRTETLIKRINEDQNFLSWRNNLLEYDNTDLAMVTRSLERHFNVSVELDEEEVTVCRFTASFSKPKLQDVLDVLSAVMNLNYELDGDQVRLSGEGCAEEMP